MVGPHGARPDLYGAQPERTALAWHRSVLSVQLGSLLLTLTAVREQAWVVVVLGAALSTVVGCWLLVRGAAQRGVSGAAPESLASGRPVPATALLRLVVAVSVLATLGLALALSRAVGAL